MAHIIDGRAYAATMRDQLAEHIAALAQHGIRPGLATVLASHQYGTRAYERRLRRLATQLDCHYVCEALDEAVTEAEAVATIGKLGADPRISGILVLRPLPEHISEAALYRALDPLKDIEAVHPINAGLLSLDRPRYTPSTPASAFHLLDRYLTESGREPDEFYARSIITIVGRSNNVGKPAILLGLARNATLLSCDVHSFKAGQLYEQTAQADILIVAAGVPNLLAADHIKPGAIAIDVGINPQPDSHTGQTHLVGDLDFDSITTKAEAVSPVPGGVGPMTDVWLLRNTVSAARHAAEITTAQACLEALRQRPLEATPATR